VASYELYPRSYRLYVYACHRCRSAKLAHNFDIELDIIPLKELEVKENDGLFFILGLEVEPRVFNFEVTQGEATIVADAEMALGELVKTNEGYAFASYSKRAKLRLCRLLKLGDCNNMPEGKLAEILAQKLEGAR
jgi:hypothetical protein